MGLAELGVSTLGLEVGHLERFFQADTGGTPVLRALRPEGPRELSPGFSLGVFPPDGKPCRGGGMPPYID
jgi:hypothetical protein